MECIILAGGFGTRIRSAIGDLPKCMAPIHNQPFLHYLFRYLAQQGAKRIILSLGYQHQMVTEWLETQDLFCPVVPVIEPKPLGTGGALMFALMQCVKPNVIVLNGDTLFPIPLRAFLADHRAHQGLVSIALKPMTDCSRYGVVTVDASGMIVGFGEKKPMREGLINGGIYAIRRKQLQNLALPAHFSFETDFLTTAVATERIVGCPFDNYFIDIGVPTDYERAQETFGSLQL